MPDWSARSSTSPRTALRSNSSPTRSSGSAFASSPASVSAPRRARVRDLRIDTEIEPGEDDADLPEDEILTTAGDDRSSFPDLIPVGQVTRTRPTNGGLTLEVFAEPLADLDELSFVNVLLYTPLD